MSNVYLVYHKKSIFDPFLRLFIVSLTQKVQNTTPFFSLKSMQNAPGNGSIPPINELRVRA